jgi:hypothetical protein
MDKDIARQIETLREELLGLETGSDPALIRLQQALAGALYAVAAADRCDYEELARARSRRNARRETTLAAATLKATAEDTPALAGDWAGDFCFGSALLRTAAAAHAVLRQHYLPLMGEGYCRSRARLEEQAARDGLISEADQRLLASIREEAGDFGQDHAPAANRAAISLNDLLVGLRILAAVVKDGVAAPRVGEARA